MAAIGFLAICGSAAIPGFYRAGTGSRQHRIGDGIMRQDPASP
jgi:hypothetical protein